MTGASDSSRREFLTGRAGIQAVRGAVDSVLGPPENTARGAAGVPRPRTSNAELPPDYLLTVSRRAMACTFEVHLPASTRGAGTEAALEALDLVDALEAQMTVYRETSEIIEINQTAASQEVEVEERLFGLLELAWELSARTEGAFDITSQPLSEVWGFSRRQGRLPDSAELAAARQRVGYRQLLLDASARTLSFSHPGVTINLNSIGKGYALDRAAERLGELAFDRFLLHGGNSSVLGRAGEDQPPWRVGVRHPLRPAERLGEVLVQDRAVGTSGSGTQHFHHGGKRYGHVLDPRTGLPAEGVLSATVLAPSGAEADALATAFYVMGPKRAETYCGEHAEISAVLICPGQSGANVEIHLFGDPDAWWLPQ